MSSTKTTSNKKGNVSPNSDKSFSRCKDIRNDIILWGASIFLSVTPVILKQLFFPSPIFETMSLFFRLLSDMSFAYAFLIGSGVLIVQVLLTVPRRIKSRIATIFISISSVFDFILFLFYNVAFLFDYAIVDSLMNKGEVGSVKDANIMVLISTIVISSVCIYLHSSTKNE